MDITQGIIFILLGILCAATAFMNDYNESAFNKVMTWVLAILAAADFAIALYSFGLIDGKREYPSSEYHLTVKAISDGERADTVYVIDRIR